MELMGGIALIARQTRLYAERRMASCFDLGFPEMQVLMALSGKDEVNQDFIAQFVGVDKGTIAKTLAKLEKRSLIARRQNPANKRENLVRLEPNAQPVLERMTDIYFAWVHDAFSGVAEEDLAAFSRVIEALCHNSTALLEHTTGEER